MHTITKILIGGALVLIGYLTFFSTDDAGIANAANVGIKPLQVPEKIAENSVGIKLVKNDQDELEMMIFNSKGVQAPLTFGSFITYSVEAILGKSLDSCPIKQGSPIFAGYEWGPNHVLYSYITTTKGKKSIFSFAHFLGALSDTIADCKENQDNQRTVPNTVPIMFEKDADNKFQAMIVSMKGEKEPLNLGNLLALTSEAFPDCNPGVEEERINQIYFDTTGKEFKIYQIDAYGLKEDLTFDNLATAAAETLETCEKDKTKPYAKLKDNSIKIKFKKDAQGNLKTYLVTTTGDEVSLNLGTLLTAAVVAVPFYSGSGRPFLEITYTKDSQGGVKGTLKDLKGNKVDLDLPNLLKAAAYFYPY